MENLIYLAIRAIAAGYILYKIWRLLFTRRLDGLWEWVFRHVSQRDSGRGTARDGTERKGGDASVPVIPDGARSVADVVGKTTIVYLEDPALATKIPAHSQKLEPSGLIGREPDISDDDVESELSPASKTAEEVSEEQERFEVMDGLSTGPDPDFSTGLTYEELSNAVGVLSVATAGEKQIIDAAKILYHIRDTDLFEFFTHQVSNQDNVEKLMSDCLDDDGTPLAVRRSKRGLEDIKPFDLNRYV